MGYESITILEKAYKDDKMCVSLHHQKLNPTTMKQFILMMLFVLGTSQYVIAQGWSGYCIAKQGVSLYNVTKMDIQKEL